MARDAALHGPGGSQVAQPDEKRVLALLDRAIAAYTGRDHPVEAWKRIVPAGQGDRPQGERPGRARASRPTWRWCWPSASGCSRPASSPATLWYGTATPAILRPAASPSTPIPAASAATAPMWPATRSSRVAFGSAKRQAGQDPHPRVRHGDRPAHPQGPQRGRRHLFHEEHVRRRRAPVRTARRRLQPRRGRPELHSQPSATRCASPSATP